MLPVRLALSNNSLFPYPFHHPPAHALPWFIPSPLLYLFFYRLKNKVYYYYWNCPISQSITKHIYNALFIKFLILGLTSLSNTLKSDFEIYFFTIPWLNFFFFPPLYFFFIISPTPSILHTESWFIDTYTYLSHLHLSSSPPQHTHSHIYGTGCIEDQRQQVLFSVF